MNRIRSCFLLLLLSCTALSLAQVNGQRLVLKDGSYQIVRKYEVKNDRVRYLSAERGEWEEIPKELVDWIATEKWAREHAPGTARPAPASSEAGQAAAEIDKEEAAERADAAARMPEVSQGLRLPDQDGVWALDTFHGQPELVRVNQSSGDVSQNTGHNVLRSAINPLGGMKQSIQIEGVKSKVQLHVNEPEIYVSLDVDTPSEPPDAAVTVDTHGASAVKNKDAHSSPASHYAIVKLQVRRNLRVVGSVNVSMLGKVSQSEDLVDTVAEVLPGKHWLRLKPRQQLSIGDYALVEVLSPKEINIDVWDFRIDPTATENANSIMPLKRVP